MWLFTGLKITKQSHTHHHWSQWKIIVVACSIQSTYIIVSCFSFTCLLVFLFGFFSSSPISIWEFFSFSIYYPSLLRCMCMPIFFLFVRSAIMQWMSLYVKIYLAIQGVSTTELQHLSIYLCWWILFRGKSTNRKRMHE